MLHWIVPSFELRGNTIALDKQNFYWQSMMSSQFDSCFSGTGHLPPPPSTEVASVEPFYEYAVNSKFEKMPKTKEDDRVHAKIYIRNDKFTNSKKFVVKARNATVTEESLWRLDRGKWLNDEIMNYCITHIYTLFCFSQSRFRTFVFPTTFMGMFIDPDKNQLNFSLATKMTEKLARGMNLFTFDHIVFVCNPKRMHWNFVVILPKEKVIENIDSFGEYDHKQTIACWFWLVRYCTEVNYHLEPSEWKIKHSRQSYYRQHDGYNCGLFTILNILALHHRCDYQNYTKYDADTLRIRLANHFRCYKTGHSSKPLMPEWIEEGEVISLLNSDDTPDVGIGRQSNTISLVSPNKVASGEKGNTKSSSNRDVASQSRSESQSAATLITQDVTPGSTTGGDGAGNNNNDPPKPPPFNLSQPLDADEQKPDVDYAKMPDSDTESDDFEIESWGSNAEPAIRDSLVEDGPEMRLKAAPMEKPQSLEVKPTTETLVDEEAIMEKPQSPEVKPTSDTSVEEEMVTEKPESPEGQPVQDDSLELAEPVPSEKDLATLSNELDTVHVASPKKSATVANPAAQASESSSSEDEINDDTLLDSLVESDDEQPKRRKKRHKKAGKPPTLEKAPRNTGTIEKSPRTAVSKHDAFKSAMAATQSYHFDPNWEYQRYERRPFPFYKLMKIPEDRANIKEMMKMVAIMKEEEDSQFHWPLPEINPGLLPKGWTLREAKKRRIKVKAEIEADLREEAKEMYKKLEEKVESLFESYVPADYQPEQHDQIGKAISHQFYGAGIDSQEDVEELESMLDREELQAHRDNEKIIQAIAVIRYVPRPDLESKGYFMGREANKDTIHDLLNPGWVASWLSAIFYRLVTQLPNMWIPLSTGSSRGGEKAPSHLLTNVKVRFPQGEANLCLIKSMASAINYMGLSKGAVSLNGQKQEYLELPGSAAFRLLQEHMKKYVPEVGIGVTMKIPKAYGTGSQKQRRKDISIQELVRDVSPYPTFVIPKPVDYDVGHAIAVVDDLIFDSTQDYALKLCKASLDWICGEGGCDSIYLAMHFRKSYETSLLKREIKYNWEL